MRSVSQGLVVKQLGKEMWVPRGSQATQLFQIGLRGEVINMKIFCLKGKRSGTQLQVVIIQP